VIVGAAFGGASVLVATADDRRLAEDYRAALSEGQGSFFAAASLEGTNGRAGTVFGYEGQPSWVMVTLRSAWNEERPFGVRVVTRDGRYIALGDAALGGDHEVWGRQIPVDLSEVQELRFVGPEGGTAFSAVFDPADPWE
jgi:hypothetical protein